MYFLVGARDLSPKVFFISHNMMWVSKYRDNSIIKVNYYRVQKEDWCGCQKMSTPLKHY